MKRFLLACALALGLSGCATPNLTVEQSLFDIQARYTELGAVVLQYVSLPLCEDVGLTDRCADEDIVHVLQRADREIFNVLEAAEAARGTVDTGQYRALAASALSRLRALIVEHAIRSALK